MSTSETADSWVGVDVGAAHVHGVRLSRRADRLVVADRYAGDGGDGLVRFCAGVARVAVDAPGGPSTGAHTGDASVAPKFRSGRCSEIPHPGVPPVSWVTPASGAPTAAWMVAGFVVWRFLRDAVAEVVETFPAAAFHRLNGGRWPPRKSTAEGRRARLDLLRHHLDLPGDAGGWGHDHIDAAAAALVAAVGSPVEHRCPHPDGSSLWLPPLAASQPPTARSAAAAMLRAMPPKTTEWNGEMTHQ